MVAKDLMQFMNAVAAAAPPLLAVGVGVVAAMATWRLIGDPPAAGPKPLKFVSGNEFVNGFPPRSHYGMGPSAPPPPDPAAA